MRTRRYLYLRGQSKYMKLLKKINNNFALALDSRGEQIIVEGRGIGFQKMPMELTDLSLVTRTYYDTKEQDVSLINSVSEEILNVSADICQYAEMKIGDKLNPNLRFILADHLDFAIERQKKKIDIKMPIYYDIQLLYPKEVQVAEYAMELIKKELKVQLPDSERTGIALNIINSEMLPEPAGENKDELIEKIAVFIEKSFSIQIDRKAFSYSRFVSHMEYLLRRAREGKQVSDDNLQLYKTVRAEIPAIDHCADEIAELLGEKGYSLNEEEKLYLMLHINRLCNREDCNQ